MKILGTFPVDVRYQSQGPTQLDPVVVSGTGPSLFGRNWLDHLRLDWPRIGAVSAGLPLSDMMNNFQDVFAKELGQIHPFTAKLHVPQDAKPRFYKPRPVPYSRREGVEEALDRLEESGIVERVSHSKWAAPIISVPKKDGTIRVCGDYSVTVNSVLDVDQYPLPRPEDLFAKLAGGKKFTTLDLAHAFNQLELDEESQRYCVINTHRGSTASYKRLPMVLPLPLLCSRGLWTRCSREWTTSFVTSMTFW